MAMLLSDGKWHHITVTVERAVTNGLVTSTTLKWYVDVAKSPIGTYTIPGTDGTLSSCSRGSYVTRDGKNSKVVDSTPEDGMQLIIGEDMAKYGSTGTTTLQHVQFHPRVLRRTSNSDTTVTLSHEVPNPFFASALAVAERETGEYYALQLKFYLAHAGQKALPPSYDTTSILETAGSDSGTCPAGLLNSALYASKTDLFSSTEVFSAQMAAGASRDAKCFKDQVCEGAEDDFARTAILQLPQYKEASFTTTPGVLFQMRHHLADCDDYFQEKFPRDLKSALETSVAARFLTARPRGPTRTAFLNTETCRKSVYGDRDGQTYFGYRAVEFDAASTFLGRNPLNLSPAVRNYYEVGSQWMFPFLLDNLGTDEYFYYDDVAGESQSMPVSRWADDANTMLVFYEVFYAPRTRVGTLLTLTVNYDPLNHRFVPSYWIQSFTPVSRELRIAYLVISIITILYTLFRIMRGIFYGHRYQKLLKLLWVKEIFVSFSFFTYLLPPQIFGQLADQVKRSTSPKAGGGAKKEPVVVKNAQKNPVSATTEGTHQNAATAAYWSRRLRGTDSSESSRSAEEESSSSAGPRPAAADPINPVSGDYDIEMTTTTLGGGGAAISRPTENSPILGNNRRVEEGSHQEESNNDKKKAHHHHSLGAAIHQSVKQVKEHSHHHHYSNAGDGLEHQAYSRHHIAGLPKFAEKEAIQHVEDTDEYLETLQKASELRSVTKDGNSPAALSDDQKIEYYMHDFVPELLGSALQRRLYAMGKVIAY